MFLAVPVGNAGTLCLLVVAANLLRGLFCGVERTSGVGTALALPAFGIASFSGSGCGVNTATGAGVSEVTGFFFGSGVDTTGGLKVGKESGITGCCGGEIGTTGTGEVWEETGGSGDAGVEGKDFGDGVGLVAMVISGCC